MAWLDPLSWASRASLFTIMAVIAVLTLIVAWAQIGCIRGRPFENPDGTADDWREQRIFYGIAWADLMVACPLSLIALVLVFVSHRLGLFLLGGVAVWMVWSNVMTTVTSLRFEKPRFTVQWFIVFPFGIAVGLAYMLWILIHFERLYGV